MNSLYKTPEEKVADIIAANASTDMRWAPTKSGTLALEACGLMHKLYLQERQATAIARLTIDRAMRSAARGVRKA
jgi:hypothetical protein